MRSPEFIFRPSSIAIVGASDAQRGGNWSRVIDENLSGAGVELPVYAVNPGRTEVWGRTCYPTLRDLPGPVDLALVVVPARFVPGVLRDGLAAGVKAAIVYASGFGESGGVGAEFGVELDEIAAAGMRITGPNCMGSVSPHERLMLYPANPPSRVRVLPAGDVGVVFQSGGTFQFWLEAAAVRGLGFRYAVTSGSERDLDMADYIEFMVDDPGTAMICCMIEGLRRPDAFMKAAARALAAGKPILAVKIGVTERARTAAQSHTGLLAGDDAVFGAMCERYGVIRCASLDDMIDAALLLESKRVPNGTRIAMMSYSGGAKGLFLDAAISAGLTFADLSGETLATMTSLMDPGLAVENPVDAGAGIPYDGPRLIALTAAMSNDPNVDIIAVQGQLPSMPDERGDASRFAAMSSATTKPMVAFSRTSQNVGAAARAFQTEAGMPFVQGIPETVRAMRAAIRYAERRRAPLAGERRVANETGTIANVAEALARAGVPGPRQTLAASPRAAAEAAARLGFPVALKVITPKIVHKTEFGAVRLGLASADAVETAATDLQTKLVAQGIGDLAYLVQEMVSGLEVVLGARDDAQYGPVLVLGLGGIFVEVLGDVALRLLPVDERDVRAMISELRGSAMFAGVRGGAPRDVDALVAAAIAFGDFYLARRTWIEDLEVNPLVVLAAGEGVRAVDVRAIERNDADRAISRSPAGAGSTVSR